MSRGYDILKNLGTTWMKWSINLGPLKNWFKTNHLQHEMAESIWSGLQYLLCVELVCFWWILCEAQHTSLNSKKHACKNHCDHTWQIAWKQVNQVKKMCILKGNISKNKLKSWVSLHKQWSLFTPHRFWNGSNRGRILNTSLSLSCVRENISETCKLHRHLYKNSTTIH